MTGFRKGPTVIAAAMGLVSAADAQAAEPADFYGTWKLRSVSAWIDGREVNPAAYGPHPTGLIHYLSGGRMAAVIAYDGRKPMKGDRLKAAESEKAEAYASFLAYAGTFRVEGDKVVHHVEASAYQNDVGSEQVRFFRRDGNTLHLESVPLMRDGKPQVYKLVWDRLPDR
ncbi:lipocalin-like domain-containing protein [Methylobacterium sp. EM32]|uniref:lipocalin-like domain-containing protein n=1 Tax=Methylobacterium sp. EM32 TaxID=3163481 RepID=UPI0033B3D726